MEDRKILLSVVSGPFSSIGGIERFLLEINDRLHRELSMRIITPDAGRSREVESWIDGYGNSGSLKFFRYKRIGALPGRIFGIVRLLRESDVVYFTTMSPLSNFAIYVMAMLLARRKTIYGMHTKYFSKDVKRGRSSLRMLASRLRYSFMLKTVKAIHLENKEEMDRHRGLGAKVYFIPPVLRLGRLGPQGRKGNKFKVLFVGRLDAFNKGLDILCEVIKALGMKAPKMEFEIVGEGKDRDMLAALGAKNLSLLGNLSDTELDSAYGNAELFVFPSRFENFGIALLEAQMRGIPAVAFRITGPSDIIRKRVQGRLARPFDAKEFASYVLEYYKLWEKDRNAYYLMRSRIEREVMKRFDPKRSAALFLSMLREVAGSR